MTKESIYDMISETVPPDKNQTLVGYAVNAKTLDRVRGLFAIDTTSYKVGSYPGVGDLLYGLQLYLNNDVPDAQFIPLWKREITIREF